MTDKAKQNRMIDSAVEQALSRPARALATKLVVCPHCYVMHYQPLGSELPPQCPSCGQRVRSGEPQP